MPHGIVTRRVHCNAAHCLCNPRCWRVLAPALRPAALKRIRLWEPDRHSVDYHGA